MIRRPAMQPEQLGKYKIVAKIGQGAMGEVFKAHDPMLNRFVAIKTMSAGIGADDELQKRFLREAQSAALLNHPNIITVYDFGEEQGKIFMAMELLEGKDLKDVIASKSLTSLEQKVSVMEQIADGLSFAHAKEIVHRDLKPANIHVQPSGSVKIMDFGLARLASSDMTRVGMIMGTPNYMSPEQVRGEKADARSDVFALGAVFYELLVNRKPFEADSLHAILYQVMQGEPEPLEKVQPDLAPALCQVVRKALTKDPGHRYQHAGELRDAVRQVQTALFPKERVGSGPRPLPPAAAPAPAPKPAARPEGSRKRKQDSAKPKEVAAAAASTPAAAAPRPVEAAPPPPMAAASPPIVPEPRSAEPPTEVPVRKAPAPMPPQVEGAVALDTAPAAGATFTPHAPATLSGFSQTQMGLPAVPAATTDAAARPRGKTPVYAAGAVGVLLVAGAAYWLSQRSGVAEIPAPPPSVAASVAPPPSTVDVLATQMANQRRLAELDLARKDLQEKRYAAAVTKAERIVAEDPANAEAKAVVDEGRRVLAEVEAAVAEVRTALEANKTAAASKALTKVLALDPENAAVPEFTTRLNSVFKTQAQEARVAMGKSRQAAERAQAGAEPEFKAAVALATEGEGLFQRSEFTAAARKFGSARDGYERARRSAERVASAPVASAPTPEPVSDDSAIRRVIAAYERALKTRDTTLFRSIKPSMSGSEERGLRGLTAQDVSLGIIALQQDGERATVKISRRDVVEGKQVSFQQTLLLAKQGGAWVISQIGR
jgi:serine/threonine-protein kinase